MNIDFTGRKAIWIMVPSGKPVDDTIAELEKHLAPGDKTVDGRARTDDCGRRTTHLTRKVHGPRQGHLDVPAPQP